MKWGEGWSSAWGDVQDFMVSYQIDASRTSVRVRFEPHADYKNRWYGIYINTRLAYRIYIGENGFCDVTLPHSSEGKVSVHVEDFGDLGDAEAYNPIFTAENFDRSQADRFTVEWQGQPVLTLRGTAFINNLVLTGLQRFYNCAPYGEDTTIGVLNVAVKDDGTGNPVLYFYSGSKVVAQGTYNPTDFTFTISQVNNSGLAGSCLYISTGSTIDVGNLFVDCRWPKTYNVYYDTIDPGPSEGSIKATVPDDGGNWYRYTSPSLAAATYFVKIQTVDSSGNEDDLPAASQAVTINAPPAPPTELQYVSGDASATIIKWRKSADDDWLGDYSYKIYAMPTEYLVDDPIPITDSLVSGIGVINPDGFIEYTLPEAPYTPEDQGYTDLSKKYQQVRYILVRCTKVSTGVEEKNVNFLKIRYDYGGDRIPLQPKTARIWSVQVTDGNKITVRVTYDPQEEEETAVWAGLWVWSYDEDDPDLEEVSPDAIEQLENSPGGGKTASIEHTVATYAGPHWIAVAVTTSPDTAGAYAVGPCYKRLLWLADQEPADVTNVTVYPGRS